MVPMDDFNLDNTFEDKDSIDEMFKDHPGLNDFVR
tara:strand:+ start:522 stop:626 length:105 start_codon:yes stop_codon:yes gene_type:complete